MFVIVIVSCFLSLENESGGMWHNNRCSLGMLHNNLSDYLTLYKLFCYDHAKSDTALMTKLLSS